MVVVLLNGIALVMISQLVLGWVSVCRQVSMSVCNQINFDWPLADAFLTLSHDGMMLNE